MRVTKFPHACILVEENGKAVLIDPGNFAWDSGMVKLENLPPINEIVITHEHADHLYLPFVAALDKAFPQAVWLTNAPVAAQLEAHGIQNITLEDTGLTSLLAVPHEKLPAGLGDPPPNLQANVFGKLTHPGDSLSFTTSKEVLCVPFISPWGSMTEASELVMKLKPKKVIPIHDFLWKVDIRNMFYGYLQPHMAQNGIELIIPAEGIAFEV